MYGDDLIHDVDFSANFNNLFYKIFPPGSAANNRWMMYKGIQPAVLHLFSSGFVRETSRGRQRRILVKEGKGFQKELVNDSGVHPLVRESHSVGAG